VREKTNGEKKDRNRGRKLQKSSPSLKGKSGKKSSVTSLNEKILMSQRKVIVGKNRPEILYAMRGRGEQKGQLSLTSGKLKVKKRISVG